MILKLENTTTHQIFEYDVIDKNYGEKLYFRFDINTLQLEDGEYSLTLYDGEEIVVTDLLKVGDFNPQTLQYKTGDNTYISIELGAKLGSKYAQITNLNTTIFPDDGYDGMTDVVIDATPIYNNTKDEWYTKGINDQKKLLSSIEIDTNGVYTNENGYDEVVVNVPDLNGAYDDGYSDGKTDGYNQGYAEGGKVGYDNGYEDGKTDGYNQGYVEGEKVSYDNGYSDGKESVAANARVLDVTENGNYLSEFSDEVNIYPEQVTGDFGDGTYFYDWGEIIGGCYNTKIPFNLETRIELWWKAAEKSTGTMWQPIFGAGLTEDKTTFEIRYYNSERDRLQVRCGNVSTNFVFDKGIWNHFVFENNTLYLNDEIVKTFSNTFSSDSTPILINTAPYCADGRYADGLFGMIKINDSIFIPKDGGFVNYQTNEQLSGYVKPTNNKATYEYIESDQITGYFNDGTPFYGSAKLINAVFYTDIIGTTDSSFEIWWKDLNLANQDYAGVIGVKQDSNSVLFKFAKRSSGLFRSEYGSDAYSGLDSYEFNYDMSNWTHIKFSKKDGLIVNGELLHSVGDKYYIINTPNNKFQINDVENGRYANGLFGMIKINGKTFIPTENGYMDIDTQELLLSNWVNENGDIPFIGQYVFTENEVIHIVPEGPMYKTVNVNVQPKINIEKEGIKFGYSTIAEIPQWADWDGITNMTNMFNNCNGLKNLQYIDTSRVTTMASMFYYCGNLETIPLLNTSNVTDMSNMFYGCGKLKTIPQIDTSKLKITTYMFYSCGSLESIPPLNAQSLESNQMFGYSDLSKLTDFGGLIGLKVNFNGNYAFNKCPNLTYQSCINILNGLYDFRGNGDSTTTRTLKVHSNFLTTVGDEISIGTDKGWIITA